MRLNNDDRCAVDLLLEQAAWPTQGVSSCYTTAASSEVQERLRRVESLLHRLQYFNPAEPPADLVQKTVARCEGRATVPANHKPLDPMATAS